MPNIRKIHGTHRICNKCGESKEMALFGLTRHKSPHAQCRTCRISQTKAAVLKNPSVKINYDKKYNQERSDIRKKYREVNKEKIRLKDKRWRDLKVKTDPIFRLKTAIRVQIYQYFKYKRKKQKVSLWYIGVPIDEAKSKLAGSFKEGMSWDNYGSNWEIDHIIPLCEAKNEIDVFKLCHISNLQPLTRVENMKKSNKRQ